MLLTNGDETVLNVAREFALNNLLHCFLGYFLIFVKHSPEKRETSLAQNLVEPKQNKTRRNSYQNCVAPCLTHLHRYIQTPQ